MKVKKFVDEQLCGKKKLLGYIETEDQSNLLLYQLFEKIAALFAPYIGQVLSEEKVLDVLNTSGTELHEQMIALYMPSWFGGSEQVMSGKKKLMNLFWRRFLPEFKAILTGATLVAVNKVATLEVEEKGEQFVFEELVHFILKKGDAFQAVIINSNKNSSKRSLNGRSDSTRIEVDLRYAVIKIALEEEYEGIALTSLYYQEGESKGQVAPWVSNGTQKSNCFHMNYSEFYEQGEFLVEVLLSRATSVIQLMCQKTQTEKCNSCVYTKECLVQKFSERKPAVKKEGNWQLPDYDEQQKKFISCTKDEILVCAGPGSGKTASLIGRILRLAEDGYAPEKILLVTYTDKAAGEIRSRLLGKFPEDEMPRIGTLHSIALEIDKIYAKMTKCQPHNVLSESEAKRQLKEVLESYNWHLTGVDYRNFCQGDMRYNTVGIVSSRLKQWEKNPDTFFYKYQDYNPSQWEKLRADMEEVKRKGNYLTYDEYIVNASSILRKSKEVRLYYHSLYEQILVDEYQDINGEQDELISLLKGDGSLACIGDDDQAIYKFKGCSSRFMQGFSTVYPNAEVIFCSTNYRSTKNIIEFNNSILSQMDDCARIAKVVEYAQYAEEGRKPVLYDRADTGMVNDIVADALSRGYGYGDIAVLATKNATLEVLHDTLPFPTELASAFVVKDFLFHVVLNTLALVIGADQSMNPLYRMGLLFEKSESWFVDMAKKKAGLDEVYDVVTFARTLSEETACHYVTRMAAYLDLDGSASEKEVLAIAEQCSSLKEFYDKLDNMRTFGDSKKIEYPIENKVTLITSHSCKGMEWPVVIVYDTENFDGECSTDGKSSMDARLFYVAASRARKELYFLKKEGSSTIIDESEFVERRKIS